MSKYNRSNHLFFSPNLQNDDKKAETIEPLLNKEIVITEKLDGSNTCFTNKFCFGRSHSAPTNNPWDIRVRQLHDIIKNSISEDMWLFGEGMEAIHSIEYLNLESVFYLFNIKYKDTWLSWQDVEDYAYILDIPTVPVLYKGVFNTEKELKDKIIELSKSKSKLEGEMEGVVIRVSEEFHNKYFPTYLQKFVRKNHVRTDSHWTKNWVNSKIKTRYPYYK